MNQLSANLSPRCQFCRVVSLAAVVGNVVEAVHSGHPSTFEELGRMAERMTEDALKAVRPSQGGVVEGVEGEVLNC